MSGPESAQPLPLVLIVDDDDAIRAMIIRWLRGRFTTLEAPNAQRAIELVAEHDVEVVVIDVMMPGMSGIQAVPLLKAKARGPLPVLLLTALDDQPSRNAGLSAGADDYLGKPVDRMELTLRVLNFVRLGRQERLIRKQLEEMSQLQALKDDLTALLVHDLRNPMTAVKSAFNLMAPNVAPQDREIFDLGKHALDRVMENVGDLLKVRMLEQGQLPLQREAVELEVLAQQVVRGIEAAALDGNISVQVIGQAKASVDRKLMTRALENLLINAFRHTRERVDVEVRQTATGVEVAVSDRGPGVPDFLKGELFDMFGSLTLQKSGGRRGHGLGLYLVRLMARAHGGEVVVRDREGGGASFVISLPAGA